MKTVRKKSLLFIVVMFLFFVTYHFFLQNSLAFKAMKVSILGDKAMQKVQEQFQVQFIPEKFILFSNVVSDTSFKPTWGYRLSHAVPCYPVPIVADVDKDGDPEIFIGSYSKAVTVIDGKKHKVLWKWQLPFGVIGGRAMFLEDLDNDGKEELIMGSNTTLPIRVYALKTSPQLSEKERLIWKTNVTGDFIEGGLNVYKGSKDTGVIILASTRDAPYSRGSLNLLNEKGSHRVDTIRQIDDCISRPPIGILGDQNQLASVQGSHNFYQPQWGNQFFAQNLITGAIIWKTPILGDGGYLNHQIADIDFDGKNEVLVMYTDRKKELHHLILNGSNGKSLYEVPWFIQGVLHKAKEILVATKDSTFCIKENRKIFSIPKIDFGIENTATGKLILLKLSNLKDTVTLSVFDGENGKLIRSIREVFAVPSHEKKSDYGIFGPPSNSISFLTLADTDNNGYWDILVQIKDFVVNMSLPYKVKDGVNPFAPYPFRNIDNGGIIYR